MSHKPENDLEGWLTRTSAGDDEFFLQQYIREVWLWPVQHQMDHVQRYILEPTHKLFCVMVPSPSDHCHACSKGWWHKKAIKTLDGRKILKADIVCYCDIPAIKTSELLKTSSGIFMSSWLTEASRYVFYFKKIPHNMQKWHNKQGGKIICPLILYQSFHIEVMQLSNFPGTDQC